MSRSSRESRFYVRRRLCAVEKAIIRLDRLPQEMFRCCARSKGFGSLLPLRTTLPVTLWETCLIYSVWIEFWFITVQ